MARHKRSSSTPRKRQREELRRLKRSTDQAEARTRKQKRLELHLRDAAE